MSDQNKLSTAEHDRIFREEILSEYKLSEKTTFDRPKAIILAGQPGAGKGGLADSAKLEMHGDVIKVDPDALRDAHPRVNEFQKAHPYTWADDTHPDASQWASELRAAAVDGKKNIIIDTTLGNGNSAVEMIKELQAKGYDVEVRAVVAHRLQSELGVDERFARDIDKKGYGRYVPEDVRTRVSQADSIA